MKSVFSRFPVVKFVLPIVVLSLGVVLLLRPSKLKPESQLSRQAQADVLQLEDAERERFLAEPNEDPEAEGDLLMAMGDYFAHRYSYPTGIFNPSWLVAAREEDAMVGRGIPNGRVPAASRDGQSLLTLDPTQFTFLGPQPLDMTGCQGCFDFGIAAGRTNVIAADPTDSAVAYIGSDGGGVWKTTNCCDANTTWTSLNDDPMFSSIAIGDIVLDPNDSNTIYAGTGDLRYGSWSFGSAGLLKSIDAGATWTILGANVFSPVYSQTAGVYPQYQAIGKVQVDPRNSDNVIVGTKQGIYFSYDGGTNWDGPCYTNAFSGQRQDTTGLLVSDNGSSTDLYAAIGTRGFPTPVQPDLGNTGANGVYKTTVPASGCPASWTLQNNGWPAGTGDGNPGNDLVGRIDLAMSPSNNQVIYAQVADNTNSSGTRGVWRTTDGGVTWTQQATPSDFSGCGGGVGQTWYNAGITVDPNDPDVVFLSMIDVYRSTNGGDTFTNLTWGYCGGVPGSAQDDVHVDNHGRAFVGGDSDTLLVSSDGGIYITHNATATQPDFTQMNNTLGTIEFYSGDITDNFAYSTDPGINGGAQDNGSMVSIWNNGVPGPATWFMTTGGDGMYARIEPSQEQRWYQESQNAGLKVSQTGPFGNYVGAAGAWSGDRLSFVFPYEIYKYCAAPGPCEHMIAGTHRVWETVQGAIPASSWYPNSPDLTKNILIVGNDNRSFINQLAFSFTDDSIAIVGTNDGNVQYGFGLGTGVANSATWVDVTDNNTVLPNRPILDVVTHPMTPTIGWAAVGGFNQNTPSTPGHVFQVTCNADCSSFSWEDKSGNLPNVPVDSIAVNPNIAKQVFAGTDWGLYFTDDITAVSPVWQKFTAGLPSVMIWDMAVDRSNSTLALFTRSRGAYAWPLPFGYDFTISAAPSTQDICIPDDAVYDIVIGQSLDFMDPVTLSASGVPSGYAESFSVNPVIPPGTSVMTLTNTGAATPGTYDIEITGMAPTSTHTTTVQINLVDVAPVSPTLTSPPDGAVAVVLSPSFAWSSVPGADEYTLEVADDAGFTNIIYSVTTDQTSHDAAITLDSGVTYYWRVTGSNVCGTGMSSEVFSFTTIDTSGACGEGTYALTVYESDLEDGAPGWTHSGTQDTWMLTDARTTSGSNAWYAEDTPTLSDQRLASPPIDIPSLAEGSDPKLLFQNYQAFEQPNTDGRCWDAGVLEVSTNGGTTWSQVPASAMLSDPYDNIIWNDTPGNNPITNDYGATEAWCDPNQAFLNALVDISAYAGQTVQFAWRLGSDSAAGNEGWYIDDVKVQACTDMPPMIEVDPSSLESTQAADSVVTQTLTISNTGVGDLSWAIVEQAPSLGRGQGGWSDDFDSYATGSQMHGQGGWKGWDNSPAAGALTSDTQANSMPNSVDIVGSADLVHEYSGYTSGQWVYTAWQYIPTGFSGQSYFLLLNDYNDGSPYNWSTQLQFDSISNQVISEFEDTTLPLVLDEWVEIRVEIDLDGDQQTVYYGGQMLTQKSWTEGVTGGGTLNIAAVDLYANSATSVYYDNLSLTPLGVVTCPVANDIPWASVSPASGIVAGGSADEVAVTFDSTGLPIGVYTGTLCIESNDSLNQLVSVPLTMNVDNVAPVAANDTYTTTRGTALTVPAPGVLGNDNDGNGDALTAVLDSDVSNGTLTLNADGSFTYTPDLGFTGIDTFTYHANDGSVDSNMATVTIAVTVPDEVLIYLPVFIKD